MNPNQNKVDMEKRMQVSCCMSLDSSCVHFNGLFLFQCLRKWGFRRCEDICWIKTNKNNPGKTKALDPKAVFQRTKVKCRRKNKTVTTKTNV